MTITAIDVLYMVGPNRSTEELRYSLRSLVHIPHGKVVIAGYKPDWVSDAVVHIDVPKDPKKYGGYGSNGHSTDALYYGCAWHGLTDDVLMMHDDMFIMEDMDSIPPMHLGSLGEVDYGSGTSVEHYFKLQDFGVARPLNYEAHVPMVINRSRMLDAIDWGWINIESKIILKRSLYGNIAGVGGNKIKDVKIREPSNQGWRMWAFISTHPTLFRDPKVGGWIKKQFPDRSPYEG